MSMISQRIMSMIRLRIISMTMLIIMSIITLKLIDMNTVRIIIRHPNNNIARITMMKHVLLTLRMKRWN